VSDEAAIRKARNETATDPTEGQKSRGNYRKGRLTLHGLRIAIENPKWTARRGKDPDGKEWSSLMHADYGYFVGTKAIDGDAVDCFIGDDLGSQLVVAIDQYRGKEFDETKFVLGTNSKEEGEKLYLKHYPRGWRLGPSATCTVDQLKAWLREGRHTRKPFVGQLVKAAAYEEPYIAFDLDGTLAKKEHPFDPTSVGAPIPGMIEILKNHLKAGDECRILTARRADGAGCDKVIHAWLEEQGLPKLRVTNRKTPGMRLLYDDRAVSVESDTGVTKAATFRGILSRLV
jgi:hypothetical protein